MTGYADDLLADRFKALTNLTDDSDWTDVLRRAGESPHPEPASNERRSASILGGRKRLLLVAALALVLTLAGVALAGRQGWGPLASIGTADHPANNSDTLPPSVLAQIRADAFPPGVRMKDPIGKRLVDQARLVATLPDGRKLYLVPTSEHRLCVETATSESCGAALNHQAPITFTAEEPGPGTAPIAFGIAMDGVVSVSFTVNGGLPITLPVHDNVFAYEATAQARTGRATFSAPLVTFADGTTELIR